MQRTPPCGLEYVVAFRGLQVASCRIAGTDWDTAVGAASSGGVPRHVRFCNGVRVRLVLILRTAWVG